MSLSSKELHKLDLFYGSSNEILRAISYWININPTDQFCIDEFIDLMEQKKEFSNLI